MADAVMVGVEAEENSGYRFSWGLAIAGGVAATAVTFFVLTLGSGFGLLLVNPATHSGPSVATFLTGGAIYFFLAQAFGFAVGGHLAGRLLGPLVESRIQEDFRAGAHGLVVWAVTVLATLTVLALAGLTAASTGATTAVLYGAMTTAKNDTAPAAYLVDILFQPPQDASASSLPPPAASASLSSAGDVSARSEAGRILEAGFARGEQLTTSDRSRLIGLVSTQARVSRDQAAGRIDSLQSDIQTKTRHAADVARRTASYASLWIAFSLLFGAIVAVAAAILARAEDDREAAGIR